MATTLDHLTGALAPSRAREHAGTQAFAWHAYACVLAASMVVVGLIWDISWHMSIGRDTFWTPAHLMIQGGGLIAGLGSGALALTLTFRGTPQAKASAVSFWGFRAPFGAWVCILGCGAMLTSAPFDDWWHDAYGLDVRIISPPHILLGLGMLGIVTGATLRTLALQNAEESPTQRRAALLYALSTGLFLSILAIFLLEWSDRRAMHSGSFYRALSLTLPIVLVGTTVAGRSKWPATTAAAIYTIVLAGTSWILMLFPAEPKLGPIYREITHFVPLDFPLLLIVPAFAIDLAWRRVQHWRVPAAAAALGAAFLVALIAAQWPFADVLMTYGRNWFFHADNFVYWQSVPSERFSFQYEQRAPGDWPLSLELLVAFAFATIASAVGIARGRWMMRVRR